MRDWISDLDRRGRGAALIGDRAGSLRRQAHPVDRHLVGVGVAGAIVGAYAHADAVADRFAGVIDHRLLESEALTAAVLEVEIGEIRLAFQRAAENSLERTVVHAESVKEEFI